MIGAALGAAPFAFGAGYGVQRHRLAKRLRAAHTRTVQWRACAEAAHARLYQTTLAVRLHATPAQQLNAHKRGVHPTPCVTALPVLEQATRELADALHQTQELVTP